MLKEIDIAIKQSNQSHPFKADAGASHNHEEGLESGESDIENLAIQRKSQIQSTFHVIFHELSDQLFALHFYLTLCRELAKLSGNVEQKLGKQLEEALLNISTNEIEVFLFYESEAALAIVKENLGESGQTSTVDWYLRKLGLKIKKNSHFQHYMQQKET